nr:phosphopantetheine-binding protein [Mycobacterium sp. SM1]
MEDSFFDLGGDSISAMQVVARARGAGLLCRPRDVFVEQTVAGLAGWWCQLVGSDRVMRVWGRWRPPDHVLVGRCGGAHRAVQSDAGAAGACGGES